MIRPYLKPDQPFCFTSGDGVAAIDIAALLGGPDTIWEQGPLERLAAAGELVAYRHDGFWQAMDTLRDKLHLEQLWAEGAPWKRW